MLPLDIDRDSHIACRVRRPKIVLGASGLGRAGMAKRDGDGRPRGDTGNDRCGTDVVVRLEIRSSTVDEEKGRNRWMLLIHSTAHATPCNMSTEAHFILGAELRAGPNSKNFIQYVFGFIKSGPRALY